MMQRTRQVSNIRKLSFNAKSKLAIIGSGPAAFYTALHILKSNANDFEIDMFEKNPNPYGLARFGVAPDHPEVKNCIDRFKDVEEYGDSFKYFGNVPISELNTSKSLKLQELYENYNGVLFAYGSTNANVPKIPGVEHPAVIDSKTFVGWYNNDPKYKSFDPPLQKAKTVSIVGNGNVAIDIVRILLGNTSRWEKTDIAENALAKLKESTVTKVNVVARKGILESKFTNKELRELLEMDKEGVYFSGYNEEDFTELLKCQKLGRVEKRRVSLIEKYAHKHKVISGEKNFRLEYLKSPVGFKVKSDELLEEMIVAKNKVVPKEDGSYELESGNGFTSIKNDLVILATGYKAEPLDEFEELNIPFEKGKILNVNGRINNGAPAYSYCSGWVASGSVGNINSTVVDSSITAETIIEDLKDVKEVKKGRSAIEALLQEKRIKPFTWAEWSKVEKKETELGKESGKVAVRLTFDEMKQL